VEFWEQQNGEKPLLLLGEEVNDRQVRSLELLGFSQDQFVQLGKEGAYIERLVIPSFANAPYLPMPAAMKWLRGHMLAGFPLEASPSSASPYLYVTRRKASRRRVLNEDEVLRIMEPLGFEVVEAENIPTLDEEIALFRGAKVIAGPLGAGLVNMIFAESAVIFELMGPEGYQNHAYYGLASSLGFPHAYLSATESEGQDFIVDLDLLQQALDVVMRAANP
jgi:capsular polysaccharide biosynthesis protein